jgi:hypothetical protein
VSRKNPIHHVPIDTGLGEIEPAGRLRLSYVMEYDASDMEAWEIEELRAEFGIGANFANFVRVIFAGAVIFRVLDETWLSTATDHNRCTGTLTTFAR